MIVWFCLSFIFNVSTYLLFDCYIRYCIFMVISPLFFFFSVPLSLDIFLFAFVTISRLIHETEEEKTNNYNNRSSIHITTHIYWMQKIKNDQILMGQKWCYLFSSSFFFFLKKNGQSFLCSPYGYLFNFFFLFWILVSLISRQIFKLFA